VEKDAQGRTTMNPFETGLENHADSYATDCKMDSQ
jgi:hypothetical protein